MSLFSFITDINRFRGVNVRTEKNKCYGIILFKDSAKNSNLWEIYIHEKLLKIQMIFVPVTSDAQ